MYSKQNTYPNFGIIIEKNNLKQSSIKTFFSSFVIEELV